ncbi:hypothetical protein GCM10011375_18850 [Hymenobacter qilianensis]|uniref:Uncharacterized protein n=3 Tax=Hymenobacter qilianensis TaxID=1385715 RepID=A0ACB5PRC8_9BACT|nr:helix-turn-helix transcriptional regulator [Hymenobacter qilianensis]QNP52059.1 helix-turn-helix transcriptional regulator [Hymenobacter qilianensis]GGF64192.1 hypothetical protein GCM10011375_18850 [Hymenobacter qilianensis]
MLSNVLRFPERIAPKLVEVQKPSGGYGYVPNAFNYQGFLVQRLYVGVGPPQRWREPTTSQQVGRLWETHASFTPHLFPIVSAEAVRAAGLDYSVISAWITEHKEAVFTHPTYAALCLRWGENASGYQVVPVDLSFPAAEPGEPVYFTPRTDWRTGHTRYHLATPLAEKSPLHLALQSQAGLAVSSWRAGGAWKRWSIDDLPAARRVLAAHGNYPSWQQRRSVYKVDVYAPAQGGKASQRQFPEHTWEFSTAEHARHWYDQLPEEQVDPKHGDLAALFFPFAVLRRHEQLIDYPFNEQVTARKTLPLLWEQGVPSAWTPSPAPAYPPPIVSTDLTTLERPAEWPLVTVAELLAELGEPRRELAARLGLTPATLHRRERSPTMWTVAELQRVAQLTQWPLATLAELLAQELAS